jgi:ABC-type transport system involved in multi-copper enzyme maturation permease subunit
MSGEEMLRTIIKKELLNNIFSFRFLVAFVLLTIIVTVTVLILTDDYLRRVDEYSLRQNDIENYMRRYAHFNRVNAILIPSQPPLPSYSLIRKISPDDYVIENVFGEFNSDPLPIMFPLIDFTFIVTILLSLIALLFSYDSICGEKEDGTLRLMLSNKLSKAKMILGKIIGGTLTLFLPFLFSLLIGLLIIHLNPRISWSGANWGALSLIVLGSILYFTFFYCLGLFISSRHRSSSSSIMTSLFVWVILILLIPNLSPYLASFLSPTPSKIKVERDIERITMDERDELMRKMWREKLTELYKQYPILDENKSLTQAEQEKKAVEDPAYKKAYQILSEQFKIIVSEANRIQNEKVSGMRTELNRKEESQMLLSLGISMISPLADFTYLATDLSSSGLRNMTHFQRIVGEWRSVFGDYAGRKRAAIEKENPTIDSWNVAVDMSDRPRFQYKEEALAGRFKWTLPFFAVLIVYNLIFFLTAFFSFIRYDVR